MGITHDEETHSHYSSRPGHSQDLISPHKPGLYDGIEGHPGSSGKIGIIKLMKTGMYN